VVASCLADGLCHPVERRGAQLPLLPVQLDPARPGRIEVDQRPGLLIRPRLQFGHHAPAETEPDGGQEVGRRRHVVRRRIERLGLVFDEIYTEFLGVDACHGAAAPRVGEVPELQLRIGVRGRNRDAVERFTRELIPLVLSGPPGATGYGEGRPPVREIVSYWPALIPRSEIRPRVEVVE